MKRPKAMYSEAALQRAVCIYLKSRKVTLRDLEYCAVPNGGHRDVRVARNMKAEGIVPGAPDLIVYIRGRAVQIELKTLKGRLSDAQRQFGDNLKALGHEYHVVFAETPGHAVTQVEGILAEKASAA